MFDNIKVEVRDTNVLKTVDDNGKLENNTVILTIDPSNLSGTRLYVDVTVKDADRVTITTPSDEPNVELQVHFTSNAQSTQRCFCASS